VLRAFHIVLGLLLPAAHAFALRPRAKKANPAAPDDTYKLWGWIEDHLEIVFPVVGVAVILLVLFAVRRGMQQQANEVAIRLRQKEEIVRLMRAKLLVNAELVAHELQLDRFHAARLLEELVREGTLVQARVAGGVASYRLKGL
jgi:hypothetical protein